MSIYNTNPDYPTDGVNFLMYTSQPQAQVGAQQFYYNGQNVVPVVPNPQPNYGYQQQDSRRYDMPVVPTPAPAPQPQQYALNQLVESRRNQQPQQVNPWAVPTYQQAQAQMQYQPQPMPQPVFQTVQYTAGASLAPNLASCNPTFDRKNAWGEQQPYNPMTVPTVNWNAVQQPAPAPVQQYGYVIQPVAYPVQQIPQAIQPNWEEIAKRNWNV